MPKRRRREKNEEIERREKGLTNFVGPTAGVQGLVEKISHQTSEPSWQSLSPLPTTRGQHLGGLSQEERDRYTDVMRKPKLAFDQKRTEWKTQIDEDTRCFVESFFEKPKVVVDKVKAKRKVKASIEFENVQTIAIAKPKFADEPLKPPATPYKIYSLKYEKKTKGKYQSANEMKDACRNAWNSMSVQEKDKYQERFQEYIADYKKEQKAQSRRKRKRRKRKEEEPRPRERRNQNQKKERAKRKD